MNSAIKKKEIFYMFSQHEGKIAAKVRISRLGKTQWKLFQKKDNYFKYKH